MSSLKGIVKNLCYKQLPLKKYLGIAYRHYHKRKLNLDNPRFFTEKLFWLKIYNGEYLKDLVMRCYDKYRVRDYITDCLGDGYLPKLYGVYNSAYDIDFSKLPTKYVLKISQSCGYNIINDGNCNLSEKEIVERLNGWLEKTNNNINKVSEYNEEKYYFDGEAKIICEEYLDDGSGCIFDTDFWCFNGKVKFYEEFYDTFSSDRTINETMIKNLYNVNGEYIPVNNGRKSNPNYTKKEHKNINKMIEMSEKLSAPFPFLRVDLYDINGRVVVGELTFIPMGGAGKIEPEGYDLAWGDWLKLPDVKL